MLFETIKIKDVKIDLGTWTKSMRKAQHLSQEQLAEQLNVSRITIQNLEAGRNITIDTLLKVLRHFDCLSKISHFVKEEIKNNSYPSLY
jgi:transcriptional regulator with XRE-family HTH domain